MPVSCGLPEVLSSPGFLPGPVHPPGPRDGEPASRHRLVLYLPRRLHYAVRNHERVQGGTACVNNLLPNAGALTARQREVLELAAKGLTNPEIAELLEISPGTVKVHMAAIYRILDVTNRTEAAVALQKQQAVVPESPQLSQDHGSIAVLPFDVMSEDPGEIHFADGLVEELITRLSRWRWFPVIARQSSFAYRGGAHDLVLVGRELGATYLVEGSVRRAGSRLRVTAQLIDARTNSHLLAETYDGDVSDAFKIQDDISEAIAAAIHPEQIRSETDIVRRMPPNDIDAWQLAMAGLAEVEQREKAACLRGIELCSRAIELDARSLIAAFALTMGHYQQLAFQWTDDPPASMRSVLQYAGLCKQIAPDDPYACLAAGTAHMLQGKVELAMEALTQATERNPSSARAWSFLGQLVGMQGEPDRGIEYLERAMKLSPRDPGMFSILAATGICHFAAGRLDEACHLLHRSAELKGDEQITWAMLASASALAGRDEEARLAVEELKLRHPQFSIDGFRLIAASVNPVYLERLVEGLRLAGFE
jgi:TolB-like protein/Flp pilus assembly protein TadD